MLNEIDLSRADLNLLVLFEVVLEERHVGRAADRLKLTPSAVSHGLGRLRRLLNDPLFLRTPKGVVPTVRATELAGPIADVLARRAERHLDRRAVRSSQLHAPLHDRRSGRRLRPCCCRRCSPELRKSAPGIDISTRQLLPTPGDISPERAWRFAFADLEARAMDIAVIPFDDIPARFHRRTLYEEDFVVAMRAGHPFAKAPTLDRYCEMQHLVVSHAGDAHGFVDEILARQGRSRRIALTVPNFMFALAVVAETDLITALPRRFAAMHAPRFDVVTVEAPLPLGRFRLTAIAPKAAMMDAGLAWFFNVLAEAEPAPRDNKRARPRNRH